MFRITVLVKKKHVNEQPKCYSQDFEQVIASMYCCHLAKQSVDIAKNSIMAEFKNPI